MAFAEDDVVLVTPADKKHPALAGIGFAQVIDKNVNGNSKFYRVAVAGQPGFLFVMEEGDLTAVPAGQPIPNRATNQLPTKKNTGHH